MKIKKLLQLACKPVAARPEFKERLLRLLLDGLVHR